MVNELNILTGSILYATFVGRTKAFPLPAGADPSRDGVGEVIDLFVAHTRAISLRGGRQELRWLTSVPLMVFISQALLTYTQEPQEGLIQEARVAL